MKEVYTLLNGLERSIKYLKKSILKFRVPLGAFKKSFAKYSADMQKVRYC